MIRIKQLNLLAAPLPLPLPVVCVCWPGRQRARLRAGMCASEEVKAKPNQQNRALAQGCARVRMRARVSGMWRVQTCVHACTCERGAGVSRTCRVMARLELLAEQAAQVMKKMDTTI